MYTLGYVDENKYERRRYTSRFKRLGFDIVGYEIKKGMPIEDLVDEIYSSEIDLLLIDYLLNERGFLGYNGDSVVDEYNKIKPGFPMLIFTSKEDQAFPHSDNPNIIYDKNYVAEKAEKFKAIIEKNIEHYLDEIESRRKKIKSLLEIRNERKLDSKEKNELFKLQFELVNLDQKTKEAPDYLLTDLKLDEISTTIEEAELLIQELKQKDA